MDPRQLRFHVQLQTQHFPTFCLKWSDLRSWAGTYLVSLTSRRNTWPCSIVGIWKVTDIIIPRGSPAALVHRLTVMYHQYDGAFLFSGTSVLVPVGSFLSQTLKKNIPLCSQTDRHTYIHSLAHIQQGDSVSVRIQCAVGFGNWVLICGWKWDRCFPSRHTQYPPHSPLVFCPWKQPPDRY